MCNYASSHTVSRRINFLSWLRLNLKGTYNKSNYSEQIGVSFGWGISLILHNLVYVMTAGHCLCQDEHNVTCGWRRPTTTQSRAIREPLKVLSLLQNDTSKEGARIPQETWCDMDLLKGRIIMEFLFKGLLYSILLRLDSDIINFNFYLTHIFGLFSLYPFINFLIMRNFHYSYFIYLARWTIQNE